MTMTALRTSIICKFHQSSKFSLRKYPRKLSHKGSLPPKSALVCRLDSKYIKGYYVEKNNYSTAKSG